MPSRNPTHMLPYGPSLLYVFHHPHLDVISAKLTDLARSANINCLKKTQLIHSKRQPPNLKRLLTRTNTFEKPLKDVRACGEKKCALCRHGHENIAEGDKWTLKNGKIIKPNKQITCKSKNLVYCVSCPHCNEHYIGECKDLRTRMNLHRNHSNPENIATPPLKVNQHLKKDARGHFRVFPFFMVPNNHQIAREAYEKHFQDTLQPTLHLRLALLHAGTEPILRASTVKLHVQTKRHVTQVTRADPYIKPTVQNSDNPHNPLPEEDPHN